MWWNIDVSSQLHIFLAIHNTVALSLCFQSELPNNGIFPHSYLPLHFWLDKAFLLDILMPVVSQKCHCKIKSHRSRLQIEDPSDPSSRSAAEKDEFAHFKREVYQKVLRKVFRSLKPWSQNGEAHRCADGVNRVLYPGILIESQDAEEAAYFCGCCAASANHPCPKCLVAQSDLHNILGTFELRTPHSMCVVLAQVHCPRSGPGQVQANFVDR